MDENIVRASRVADIAPVERGRPDAERHDPTARMKPRDTFVYNIAEIVDAGA
jgi:hypothetical protein